MYSQNIDAIFQQEIKGFVLKPESTTKKFKDLQTFIDFITKENEYWNKCTKGTISQIRQKMAQILSDLKTFEKLISNKNEEQAIRSLKSGILNAKQPNYPYLIYSTTKLGSTLGNLYSENPALAEGYLAYYTNSDFNISNMYYLKGAIQAHLDTAKYSELSKHYQLVQQQLIQLKDNYTKEFDDLNERQISKISEYENSNTTIVDELLKWKDEFENKASDESTRIKDNFASIEKLYREKLRLEAPANYWEEHKKSYRKSGIIWSSISAILAGVIIAICLHLLNNMPEKLFEGNKLIIENTIKWTILLAVVLSSAFYLFRTALKIALSSFHLSRDANERLQLTHMYLSLLASNAIDEKHKEIILQSLFSRADTGLLKGDSSPTMPDSIVSNIIKNLK